jgi:hypothetical protein
MNTQVQLAQQAVENQLAAMAIAHEAQIAALDAEFNIDAQLAEMLALLKV